MAAPLTKRINISTASEDTGNRKSVPNMPCSTMPYQSAQEANVLRVKFVLVAVVLSVLVSPVLACGGEPAEELRLLPVASAGALLGEEGGNGGRMLYVLILPDGSAVVLRPLSPEEYNAFQVRAVSYEIIEREMLASCFVLPRVSPGEIAGITPELLRLLKRAVNEISGFSVFAEASPLP